MIARLTPTRHADVKDPCGIIPPSELNPYFKGTFVKIWLEENPYAQERDGVRLAVRVDCKGSKLGYLPELSTVTDWKGEDHEWSKAVAAIRTQIWVEYDAHGFIGTKEYPQWDGTVAWCRYEQGGKYIEYDEYTVLSVEDQQGWRLEQCSVAFPVE